MGGARLDAFCFREEVSQIVRLRAPQPDPAPRSPEPAANSLLPVSDLLAESLAQERWSERSAVEQDRINAWAITEEFGEMSGDRAVGGIRKPPLPQCGLRPVRPRARIAEGKEAIQQ